MLWLLPVGLLSLLLFKTRISCPCYLEHSLSICSLLASFCITFLNLVKHLCSLRDRSQHLGRHKPGLHVTNVESDFGAGWRGSCCCPQPFLALPAGTAAAVVELWGRSGKWVALKLCSSFSDGLISQVLCTVQQRWASSRAVEEGEEGLENRLHHWVIHHTELCSQYCVHAGSTAMVFSPQAEGKSLSIAWRYKKKAGLAVNRMTPIRHPQGTLNVHSLNSKDPKMPWG